EGGLMTRHAEGEFELRSFDEEPIQQFDNGTKITRARIVTAYAGDLAGEATADLVMYYRPDGTARIFGFQRFVGTLAGRPGSFVMESLGGYDGQEATSATTIMLGQGEGELKELTGTGATAAPHGPHGTYTLDYDG